MHEYSLMENLLKAILENLKDQSVDSSEQVKEVFIRMGALEIHSEESFRQAFTVLAKGTLVEKAVLKLELVPARFECTKCGYKEPSHGEGADIHDPTPCAPCPSCGAVNILQGGRGVEAVDLVVQKTPA
jgi:hydrogenase nickel incorporation protein HypA/HybF